MLTLGLTGRIWICIQPQDGRKSFDGLQAVVRDYLARDPLSGDLFVFRNRRGDRLKILAWQGDGFALYLRRLERGTFAFPAAAAARTTSGSSPTYRFARHARLKIRRSSFGSSPGRAMRRKKASPLWPSWQLVYVRP